MKEIERKFLVRRVPAGVVDWVPIRQGYLCLGAGAAVRVRMQGGRHYLTCKRGVGVVRDEWEVELSQDQWEALWPATVAARIEKRRGRIVVAGTTAIVDVFQGELAGLAMAEVEFGTAEAAYAFIPPSWMIQDVTDDPRYGNRTLATAGLPTDGPVHPDLPTLASAD